VNESLHALSGAYVVDALDAQERETFEQHLPGCLDCQREVASLREATALMADDAALTPPPALRDSVLAGIRTIRPLPPETGAADAPAAEQEAPLAKVLPLRRRFVANRLVAAAAAVLVVAGGVTVWEQNRDDTSTNQLSATDAVLAASDAKHVSIDFKDGSSATVVRSMSKGQAVLLTQDMALPPSGKAFEVWLQDERGTMIPAGMMKRQPDNKMLLEGDAARATGVGITVEPESGSKTPTTEPIALFELDKADA
jgi:anti-sigma-K factor RskA